MMRPVNVETISDMSPHLAFELLQLGHRLGDLVLAGLERARVLDLGGKLLDAKLGQLVAVGSNPFLRGVDLLPGVDDRLPRQPTLIDQLLLGRQLLAEPGQVGVRSLDGLFYSLPALREEDELQVDLLARVRRCQSMLDAEVVQREPDLADLVEDVRLGDPRDNLSFPNDVAHVDGYVRDSPACSGGDLQDTAALEENALAADPGGDAPFEPPDNRCPHQKAESGQGDPPARPRYPQQCVELLGRRETVE